jgi:hypothetical protein
MKESLLYLYKILKLQDLPEGNLVIKNIQTGVQPPLLSYPAPIPVPVNPPVNLDARMAALSQPVNDLATLTQLTECV